MTSPLQLLNMDGDFNEQALKNFVQTIQLQLFGKSYVVVGIMGPQSSGKSTLLNCLFGTGFVEMDAMKGRYQTTLGVWLAKAEGLTPCTLIMDLEGADGRERGEENTNFERQLALFALGRADILLINLWHHDYGREHAACWPLLRTVFAVMLRHYSKKVRRKMTLMYVFRDVSRVESLVRLERQLSEDLEQLWSTVTKPADDVGARLRDYFDVKVKILTHYEFQRDEFQEQVAELRNLFQHSIEEGGLAGDRSGTVAGDAFFRETKLLWDSVKANKDLDLPSIRVAASNYRCDEAAAENVEKCLKKNEAWLAFEQQAQKDVIEGFGRKAGASVKECFDGYRKDTIYHDVTIVTRRLESLKREVWTVVQRPYVSQIKRLKDQTLSRFKRSFDSRSTISSMRVRDHILPTLIQGAMDSFGRGCEDAKVAELDWDRFKEEAPVEASKELREDIDTHVREKREAKPSETKFSCQKKLTADLQAHTTALLAEAGKSTSGSGVWREIGDQVKSQVVVALSNFEIEFPFDSNEEDLDKVRKSLVQSGRDAVVDTVKRGRKRVHELAMERFMYKFTRDENGLPRQWASKNYDIPAITRDALISSLRLLGAYAAIRLEKGNPQGESCDVWLSDLVPVPEGKIKAAFNGIGRYFSAEKSPAEKGEEALLKLSKMASWPGVSEHDTLITPLKFKSEWESLDTKIRGLIDKSIKERKALGSATRKSYAMTGIAVTGCVIALSAVAAEI